MTIREKIIVGVMCLTIAYGAYELISAGPAKSKPTAALTTANPMEDLRKFVADISKSLTTSPGNTPHAYLAVQAGEEWRKDPFIHSTSPLKSQLPKPSSAMREEEISRKPVKSFLFSGFLQMGATRMAIINGLEYAVGESLGTSGYFVKSISSKQVVIGELNGSETIVVELRDIDSEPMAPTQKTWN